MCSYCHSHEISSQFRPMDKVSWCPSRVYYTCLLWQPIAVWFVVFEHGTNDCQPETAVSIATSLSCASWILESTDQGTFVVNQNRQIKCVNWTIDLINHVFTTFCKWNEKYTIYASKSHNEGVFTFDQLSYLLHKLWSNQCEKSDSLINLERFSSLIRAL